MSVMEGSDSIEIGGSLLGVTKFPLCELCHWGAVDALFPVDGRPPHWLARKIEV